MKSLKPLLAALLIGATALPASVAVSQPATRQRVAPPRARIVRRTVCAAEEHVAPTTWLAATPVAAPVTETSTGLDAWTA